MKIALIILAVAIVACSTSAHEEILESGASEIGPLMSALAPQQRQESLVRQKRFTCDLLSFGARGVSGFNHAACAAKCLRHRHFGGHCDGPECKCVNKKW